MNVPKKSNQQSVEEIKKSHSRLEKLGSDKVKRKQIEDALKESEEHARIFASYQQAISELREFYVKQATFDQMLQKTVNLFVKSFGYYMAWYGELKAQDKVIIPKVWAGKYEKYLDGLRLELDDSKDAKCAMSLAIVSKEPFGYADLEHDKDFEKWRPLALKYGYRSNQAIPLIIDGKSVGAFLIYSTRPWAFSEDLIRYLAGIANELATIVENITERKQAEEALHKRTEELTVLNEMAMELAVASSTADVYKLVCEKLKNITGALLTAVTSYHSHGPQLRIEHISANSKLITKASKILGQKVKELRIPLEPCHIEELLSEKAKRLEGLHELMFGSIPRTLAKILEKTLRIGDVYGLVLHYGGKIMGTMPILMPHQKPPLSIEMLKAFANLVATSLQRMKAEEERVAAVQERAAIVDAMSDPLVVLNTNGQIISCNQAHLKMFGHGSVNEILEKRFGDLREVFCDPEDIPRMLRAFNRIIQNGFSEPIEVRVRRADGKELTVSASCSLQRDAKGNPLNVIAILRDITPQKRLQEMEKEAAVTRMAVEMIEGMLEGVAIMDLDGTIRQINKEFERRSGYKRKEVFGKNLIELGIISKEENERIEKEVMPELLKEGFVRNFETLVMRRDGKRFPVLTNWTLMKDAQGNPKSIIATATDITERKRAEEKLLNYQEQLRSMTSELSLIEERERRRIATELHDRIVQPLVFSKMKLDRLQASTTSGALGRPLEEISDMLDKVVEETQTLTYDLGSPTLYELGLEAAVKEWLTEEVEQKHNIATFFEDDGAPKPLDEDISACLLRAVRELLVNVVKHARALNIKVSICREGDKIRICVADDGVGFELSDTSFSRGKKGGYGLFSIKERLSHIGGCLDIKSQPGHGTSVVLIAPLKQKDVTAGG